MEKTWLGSLKGMFARWFSRPGWDEPPPETRGVAYEAPSTTMWREGHKKMPVGGPAKKKSRTHRKDGFHPRGAVGRRGARPWKGDRKQALPHRGSRA